MQPTSLLNISVIIATKDRYKDLFNCLDSLTIQTYLPQEIIIVDSSADQKIKNELQKRSDYKFPVKYIRSKAGLTLQRNVGVKTATGELLAFFDDDIVLNNDFFEQAVAVFMNDKNEKTAGVTGRITNEIFPRWSLQGIFRFLTFFSYSAFGRVRISGFHTEYNWCDKPLKVEWLLGGLTLYRRKVFDEFSFDENLEGYGYNEDLDFSYRVSRKYECRYLPSAKALHIKSGGRLSPEVARAVVINNYYLLHKNILPGKNATMKFLHMTTFYIAIISFLFFLLITAKFKTFKEGIVALFDVWLKKNDLIKKIDLAI